MEVVGAVASCIALGQALAAVPKIVGFFQSLPEIQEEALALINELETLRLTQQQMKDLQELGENQGLGHLVDAHLLVRAERELSHVMSRLKRLVNDCQVRTRGSAESKPKIKHLKWLMKKHQVPDLYQRTLRIRADLQVAMVSMSLRLQHSQTKILLEIRQVTETRSPVADDGLQEGCVDDDHDLGVPTTHDVSRNSSMAPPDALAAGDTPASLLRLARVDREDPAIGFSRRGGSLIHLQASMMGVCPTSCRCQCHIQRSRRKSSKFDLLAPILGSFLLSYNVASVWQPMGCTEPDCRRSTSSVHLNYSFPAWLCSRVISLQLSLSSIANLGATLHFTVGRILPFDDIGAIWSAWGNPRQLSARDQTYYPCDATSDGVSLLEWAISYRNDEMIEYWLGLWHPILRSRGCERRVVSTAYRALNEISRENWAADLTAQALQRVIAFNHDPDSRTDSQVHHALLLQDHDLLRAALDNEPWVLNAIDLSGSAPIHLAAGLDDTVALDELVRRGADINCRNLWEETALIVAALYSSVSCAQRLMIMPECDMGAISQYGISALDAALRSLTRSSCEVVEMLLFRMPSLAYSHRLHGRTCLHILRGWNVKTESERQVFQTNFDMILDAGAQMEVVDKYGRTVLGGALLVDDLEYCRVLIERGARTDGICDINSARNILHIAALHCNLPMLQYLREMQLTGLDIEDKDIGGCTAWDCFIFVLEMDENLWPSFRKPDHLEVMAFVDLYTDVRDRSLRDEIGLLEPILAAIRSESRVDALTLLESLISRKEKAGRSEDVDTYRTIRLQVQEQMWEAAAESVEEKVEVLEEAIATSPWERTSRFDGRVKRQYPRLLGSDRPWGGESADAGSEDNSEADDYDNDDEDEDKEDGDNDEEDEDDDDDDDDARSYYSTVSV